MKVCAYNECKEIIDDADYVQESSDKSYQNIYFHRKCHEKLMGEVINDEGLELYLATNSDL